MFEGWCTAAGVLLNDQWLWRDDENMYNFLSDENLLISLLKLLTLYFAEYGF
jgi:hypothetical protein